MDRAHAERATASNGRGLRTLRARARGVLGAALVAVALAGCASPASSTAPAPTITASTSTPTVSTPPVAVDEIAQGAQPDAVQVDVAGPVQVNVREITIHPGGGTGKHCHYGELIAVVKQGALTHYAPTHPGGVEVYHAGDTIIEGPGYVHEGKNEGSEDVVLWVTYVTPQGKPLAESNLALCAG